MKKRYSILLFVCIFFLLVGFAGVNTTLFSMGSTTVGINLDDKDIYIGNLYVNGINRFNSISNDMNSFSLDIEDISTIDFYVVNNSTQYDQEITLTCINDELTLNYDYNKTVYAGETLKGSITTTGVTSEELICSLSNVPKGRTSNVTDKKTVLFNLDGYENETVYKVITGTTYGEMPTPEIDGYRFLGWFNQNDELVTSNTSITNFNDEILTGKLEMLSCSFEDGYSWNFDFVNTEQMFNAPCEGTYKLEVWGAQGGIRSANMTNFGGYSVGETNLNLNDSLYINVGGQGGYTTASGASKTTLSITGGYNGGGNSRIGSQGGGGGGGATHIASTSGILSSLSGKIGNIYIVAGGGGGSYSASSSSAGGYVGSNGFDTWINSSTQQYAPGFIGTGGTQTVGGYAYSYGSKVTFGDGSFGQGGTFSEEEYCGNHGGGGGFYGGGASGREHGSAGGGSGYIGNSLLSNKVMYCYNCARSTATDTKTETTTCSNATATANCAKQGNGYARITLVKSKTNKTKTDVGSTWVYTYNDRINVYDFEVPVSGTYKIELWGSGADNRKSSMLVNTQGLGAYTSGLIKFKENDTFTIHLGSIKGTNGGGLAEANGGGATDIRINSSLNSRIMVAAGGGGGLHYDRATLVSKGDAGGLIGYDADSTLSGQTYTTGYAGHGGTQTAGGATGTYGFDTYTASMNGSFGQGGYYNGRASGGGGGWYGGGHGRHPGSSWPGGGGGSSYISGHAGALAVSSASSTSLKSGCSSTSTSVDCSISYTGYSFYNTTMIDGRGYTWTTSRGSQTGMPTIDGKSTMTGNIGNGYAKITLISLN